MSLTLFQDESVDGDNSGLRDGERTPTQDSPGPLRKPKKEPTWKPKARMEDIEAFIQASRLLFSLFPFSPDIHEICRVVYCRVKFVEYELPGDTSTLFGLPPPIHTSVNTLKKHLFTSLADLQVCTHSWIRSGYSSRAVFSSKICSFFR